MSFPDLVSSAQTYFPKLQIRYKDQSFFMKCLGKLLFFNKSFMSEYFTTINSNIYIPNINYTKNHPVSSAVVFMHELVHLFDAGKISKPLFTFLYLCPQILSLLCLPLFLLSWHMALPLVILFLLPIIPAYFRMNFEKRAYISSLYVINGLGKKLGFDPNLSSQCDFFVSEFNGSYYYFMWLFPIRNDFNLAMSLVQSGKRPYDDKIFDVLDDLLTKV